MIKMRLGRYCVRCNGGKHYRNALLSFVFEEDGEGEKIRGLFGAFLARYNFYGKWTRASEAGDF